MPVSLRMATNRICQADCHEESCGNALYDVACSSGTSARLFPVERDGRGLAQRRVPRGEIAPVQRGRSIVCRNGQISRVGIHHPWRVTVRAAGRFIALRENHHASGVALKVLATWAGAVNDSDPCANCYTRSKRRSSVTANALRKWRLSPLLSPCSRPRYTWVVAGVAAVATPTSMPNEKIRTHTLNNVALDGNRGEILMVKVGVV